MQHPVFHRTAQVDGVSIFKREAGWTLRMSRSRLPEEIALLVRRFLS
jgi:hypothetical protein